MYANAQKAARETLRSLNWPPKQTNYHKYNYFTRLYTCKRRHRAVLVCTCIIYHFSDS